MPINTQTIYEYSATVAAGIVIRTNPANLSEAPNNSTVTMYVSLGPSAAAVPTLIGESLSAAYALLNAAGLVSGVVSYVINPSALYVITAQSPDPDEPAAPGDAVDYTVGVLGTVVKGHGRRRH